ncbi:pomgnt2 [Acrasis kona]|uniref:Pomgnt2 n=1 Tax=Acrasis kona TaxID=1008807 RepID=A0AAW2ZLC4_9EUKA
MDAEHHEEDINKDNSHEQGGNTAKYIADSSVPGISKFLRMMGIDCACDCSYTDAYIIFIARSEDRIIITRSSKLHARLQSYENKKAKLERQLEKAKNTGDEEYIEIIQDELDEIKPLKYYWVESLGRENQILDVTGHFKIRYIPELLFSRCVKCNGKVRRVVNKNDIKDKVYELTLEKNDYFVQCEKCDNVYYGNEQGNAFQKKLWKSARDLCNRLSYEDTTSH